VEGEAGDGKVAAVPSSHLTRRPPLILLVPFPFLSPTRSHGLLVVSSAVQAERRREEKMRIIRKGFSEDILKK
jgi:hypothetical protein